MLEPYNYFIVSNKLKEETKMAEEITPEFREFVVRGTLLKRSGKPSEVASLITYLALDAPSYLINQNISISGGL